MTASKEASLPHTQPESSYLIHIRCRSCIPGLLQQTKLQEEASVQTSVLLPQSHRKKDLIHRFQSQAASHALFDRFRLRQNLFYIH